ncbi:MAG: hypothetical protein UU98_C0044G0011 [Parcubacteria group bacterium GW2011_GWD2_42_14]|nr:MAG: hypothetical protein UU98_C0044G0011 [Parcubacteria group bacterium GW2011_GWD2_42_14]
MLKIVYKKMYSRTTRVVVGGILILLAPIVLFVSHLFISTHNKTQISENVELLEKGLRSDELYLLAQSQELNASETFDRHLQSGELAELLSSAIAEKDRRKLDGLLITDANGVVVTRTKAVQQRGDYILHSTSWGREVLNGNEVASIEAGVAFPLVVQGVVPMERNSKLFGSIVSSYVVDDAYAIRSQQQWMPRDTHIAFHVPGKGVIADSFINDEYSTLLAFYFTEGMNDLGTTTIRVVIGGDQYLVQSVTLKGSTDSPGHVLIFFPSKSFFYQIAIASATALLVLGVIVLLTLLLQKKKNMLLFGWVSIFLCAVVCVFVYIGSGNYFAKNAIILSLPHYTIYNSTLELDPPSATLSQQFEYRVGIKLLSGGEAINAAEILLAYDPQKIQVIEIDFSRSFCNQSLILQRDIDNNAGLVHIVCGIPGTGFSERSGIVADLFLQPTEDGLFTLKFAPETKVLASDGLGTEVLRYAVDGSYVIAKQLGPEETVSGQTLVFSPTHQNQERWYSKRETVFTWTQRNDSTYRYSFDNSIEDGFTSATSIKGDTLQVAVLTDGIHYFTLESRSDAGVQRVNYKVKIDSQSPIPPTVNVSTNKPHVGELVRFEFMGSDALSGLQSNFYIKFDDGIFFPFGNSFVTAFYESGKHTVTVRTYDLANNFSDTVVPIVVQSQLQAALGSLFQ